MVKLRFSRLPLPHFGFHLILHVEAAFHTQSDSCSHPIS
jgi:hypothetical protein